MKLSEFSCDPGQWTDAQKEAIIMAIARRSEPFTADEAERFADKIAEIKIEMTMIDLALSGKIATWVNDKGELVSSRNHNDKP